LWISGEDIFPCIQCYDDCGFDGIFPEDFITGFVSDQSRAVLSLSQVKGTGIFRAVLIGLRKQVRKLARSAMTEFS
jgi:hypothetical protein